MSVKIGDSVTSIGDYAFSFCGRLMSVTIPDNVISIGSSAFSSCSSLTSVIIGNGVASISEGMFEYCDSLKEVHYKGTKKQAITKLKVKNKRWREDSSIEKIICSDGEILL